MPIVQVYLNVTNEEYQGIMDETLFLQGLLKDCQNKVRKHVARVDISRSDRPTSTEWSGVWQTVKTHKKMAIGVGAALTLATVGTYTYNKFYHKPHDNAGHQLSKFYKTIKAYVKASRFGKLNLKVINNLLKTLNALDKNIFESGTDLSQLDELIYNIYTYTEELAQVNEYEVEISEPQTSDTGKIISLKSYLETQKLMLENIA